MSRLSNESVVVDLRMISPSDSATAAGDSNRDTGNIPSMPATTFSNENLLDKNEEQTVKEALHPPYMTVPIIIGSRYEDGGATYIAKLNEFADGSGSYELMAVWSVSMPEFTRVGESTSARISVKNSKGGHLKKSGYVMVAEGDSLSYKPHTVSLLFCANIRINAGDCVEAKLELSFDQAQAPPPTTVKSVSDQSGDDSSDNNNKHDDNNAEKGDYHKPGTVFSFELRPYDSQVLEDAATTTGTVLIIVDDEVRTALEFTPASIKNNPRATVLTTSISQDHKTLGILSAVPTMAATEDDQARLLHLEIWDLVGIDSPIHPREPAASVSIPLNEQDVFSLSIAISSDGEFVSVFEKPCKGRTWRVGIPRLESKSFPARLFQRQRVKRQRSSSTKSSSIAPFITTSVTDHGLAATNIGIGSNDSTQELQELEHAATLLSTFVGFAKFQHCSTESSSSTTSRREFVFITCDGRHLDIYEAKLRITRLYTISLAPLLFNCNLRKSCKMLMSSLQDTLFAWCAAEPDKGTSVWNWRTGKCIGHFPPARTVSIPIDESVVIITDGKYTAAYSTATGILHSLKEAPSGPGNLRCDTRGELNGQFTMLMSDEKRNKKTIRLVDIRNVEDFREFKMDAFTKSSRPWHVSPLPLGPWSIGTVVTSSLSTIEFFDFSAAPTRCGRHCQHLKESTWPEFVGRDKHMYTYKLVRATQGHAEWIDRVVRFTDRGESNNPEAEGETVLEFKALGCDGYWSGLFLSCEQRFLIFTPTGFELWRLPITQFGQCSLLAMRTARGDFQLCHHGVVSQFDEAIYDTATNNFVRPEDTTAFMSRIEEFTTYYNDFPKTYQDALVKFSMRHINKDRDYGEKGRSNLNDSRRSVMWKIILECVGQGKSDFLRAVLQSHHSGYWVPRDGEFSAKAENDMIAYLASEFKFPIARLLIDYCLARAQSTDLRFLEILMVSVPHLQERHPDAALDISRRAAFIPVRARATSLQLAVNNGTQWRWKFWLPAETSLYEVMDQNPVFQLLDRLPILPTEERIQQQTMSTLEELHRKNADIKSNLYVVPFSLIWTIKGQRKLQNDSGNRVRKEQPPADNEDREGEPPAGNRDREEYPLAVNRDREEEHPAGLLLLTLRMLKHFVNPFDTVHIGSIYSNLDVFDNLALAALMRYKWTRFARYFWSCRLVFQVTYEFLVIGVTLSHIYGDKDKPDNYLVGSYVAIIVLGYLLLHLEFQQMRGGLRRYLSSPYNYIDLPAFVIPMASSCALIADPKNVGALRALSFSVVLVYIHFIFELRVFRNVCKVVTIVVNILLHIPAFFVILAIFILAFAHSINHLTEVNYRSVNCLSNDDGAAPDCQTIRDEFPLNYFQSVSATYFFMTGNYNPVQASLAGGHWTSQLMVGLYFFLTAVLMMNVVIALMNGVYGDAVIAADQIWLKNRLDLVASAENLTYFLPYFRDRFNYFPKYIYYTATDKDVKDYRKKYALDKRKLEFDFSPKPVLEAVSEKNVQEIESGLLKAIEIKLSDLQKAHERAIETRLSEQQKAHEAAMETTLSELRKAHEGDMSKIMSFLMERLPGSAANVVAAEQPPNPSS
ncbi:hypothetical protein BGZ72_003682 [Mortierella alpina]|nr:hypothetical protein BGZ72_003682 [Mortierella alpina]